MENLLENFLRNFEQTQRHVFHFLQKKFTNSKLTNADFEDAISIAFEKLLLDAAKPQPTLTPCYNTICRLAFFAICDMYRKEKRKVLIDDFSKIPPSVSQIHEATDRAFLEKKQLIEVVIAEVQKLPKRQCGLLVAKYDAKYFDTTDSLSEIADFKNRQSTKLTQQFGFPTDGAMRAEVCRGIRTLRLQFRA